MALLTNKALPSSSAASMCAALFGPGASNVQRVDLPSGCWLLRGKLPSALQPTEQELTDLWAAQPQEREHYEMYGKPVAVPRYMRLHSKGPLAVTVSGSSFAATPL